MKQIKTPVHPVIKRNSDNSLFFPPLRTATLRPKPPLIAAHFYPFSLTFSFFREPDYRHITNKKRTPFLPATLTGCPPEGKPSGSVLSLQRCRLPGKRQPFLSRAGRIVESARRYIFLSTSTHSVANLPAHRESGRLFPFLFNILNFAYHEHYEHQHLHGRLHRLEPGTEN